MPQTPAGDVIGNMLHNTFSVACTHVRTHVLHSRAQARALSGASGGIELFEMCTVFMICLIRSVVKRHAKPSHVDASFIDHQREIAVISQ